VSEFDFGMEKDLSETVNRVDARMQLLIRESPARAKKLAKNAPSGCVT
jgi:hypothetical protein